MRRRRWWLPGLVGAAGFTGLLTTTPCGSAGELDRSAPVAECRIRLPATPHRISPDIYGMAVAPLRMLTNACVPLNRWGGNTACRYNWKLGDAWNTGNDWFFENVAVERNAWQGFLRRTEQSGGRAIITLPLVGFVARDTRSTGFPSANTGRSRRRTQTVRMPVTGCGRMESP